jgi:C4-type Zn-finger protein
MLVKKICPVCGKFFIPKTYRHTFCSKKCFYKDYQSKNKSNEYPDYICPECGIKTRLTFFPRVSRVKWSKFVCPGCNIKNSDDDYQEIQSIKLLFKIEDSLDE